MKLAIGKKQTRKFKVAAEEPGDFLEVKKHVFDVEFNVLPNSKVAEIRAISGDAELLDDAVKSHLVSISGVKNEDGTDAEFTPELVNALFEISWVRNALIQAFFNIQNGETQAAVYKALKAKN
jgi:hypothetical protein